MTTTIATITQAVPETLTSVYTNNTAKGAVLKSININGVADPNNFVETTGALDWSPLGQNYHSFIETWGGVTGAGFGAPFPVQLSDTRLILFYLPHFRHQAQGLDYMGGNTLHTQIVEYQNGKYVAGPIININISSGFFTDSSFSLWSRPNSMSGSYNSQSCFKAIALNSTTVVFAIRQRGIFNLYKINIANNSVTQSSLVSYDVGQSAAAATYTSYAFDLTNVPGTDTKVILAASSNTTGSPAFVMSFDVPTSGAITLTSRFSSVTSSITSSPAYPITIAPLTKQQISGVVTYVVAISTASTTFSYFLLSFTPATNTFTTVGTVSSVTASTGVFSLKAMCLSSDATANAVVVLTDSDYSCKFARQTSLTQGSLSFSSNNLQVSLGTRAISTAWNWGDNRAVFIGEYSTLFCIDNTGTCTSLISANESTDTNRIHLQWLPFNTRPLYTYYDTKRNKLAQYFSKIDISSSISVGTTNALNNYFPYGFDYGTGYALNELLNCWTVAQGGRIYNISKDGTILDETSLYDLLNSTNDSSSFYYFNLGLVQVTPTGKIACSGTYHIGTNISTNYNINSSYSQSTTQGGYTFWVSEVKSSAELKSATAASSIVSTTSCPVHSVLDPLIKDRLTVIGNTSFSTGSYFGYNVIDGTGSSLFSGNFGLPGTNVAMSNNIGFRTNFRILPEVMRGNTYYRLIGQQGLESYANASSFGVSDSYAFTSFTSFSTQTFQISLNQNATYGYGMASAQTSKGMIISMPVYSVNNQTQDANKTVVLFTKDWKLLCSYYPGLMIDNTNRKFASLRASKYGFTLALQNTSTSLNQSNVYVFDSLNALTYRTTLTPTTGNGWATINSDEYRLDISSGDVNKIYTIAGKNDQVKFSATINNGTTDFYITSPYGQDVSSSDMIKSKETYLIPAGYSLKIKCNAPNSISTMITIVEDN